MSLLPKDWLDFRWIDFIQRMEMQPLEIYQRAFIWLCVCPSNPNTSKWLKILHQLTTIVSIAVLVIGLFASTVYFMKYSSTNTQESLFALFQVSGNLLLENSVIVGFLFRSQIIDTFRLLSDICSLGEVPSTFLWLNSDNFKNRNFNITKAKHGNIKKIISQHF